MSDKEFFGGLNVFDEEERLSERCYWRRVGFVIFAAALLAVILAPLMVNAEPVYQLSQGGVVITLHSEGCALKEVSNLPHRATWTENGKVYEGCFGVQPAMQAVMMYFTDRSVAVAPASIFQKVTGA